jgi:hypothetical protein
VTTSDNVATAVRVTEAPQPVLAFEATHARWRLTSLRLDLAVLIVFPLLLLLVNNSWSYGWVKTPSGATWVKAGNQQEAPPPGWLVNYRANSLDTPIAWVDTFVYQSFFLDLKGNLNLQSETWRGSYYPSRLPWLLLGNAVYSLAPPEAANVILRLVLFYVAIFSLYYTVRTVTRNDLAGLVSALVLGVNTYFLWAIGWNYVDGFAIATLLLMLAFLTRAAVSSSSKVPLFLAGVTAATVVSVNLFLIVVAPAALVWYLAINGRHQKHGRYASVAWVIAGGAAGVTAYGLTNFALTGEFFYLAPQIVWAKSSPTPSIRPLYPEAGWLVMPGAAAVLSALFVLIAGWRRLAKRALDEAESLALASGVVFLLVAGVFACLELFTTSNVLEHPFYASYLLPFVSLVAGAAVHLVGGKLDVPLRTRGLVIAGVVTALLAPFVVGSLRFMPGCPDGCLESNRTQILIVMAVGLCTIAILTRTARAGLALLVVFSLLNVGVADRRVLAFSGSERQATQHSSALVLDADAFIREHDPHGEVRYWVDLTDRFGWVYAAVAGQHLWNQRLLSLEFPRLRPDVKLIAGMQVMLASVDDDETVIARANEALVPQGFHVEVFDKARIQRGNDGFHLYLTKVISGARQDSVPAGKD